VDLRVVVQAAVVEARIPGGVSVREAPGVVRSGVGGLRGRRIHEATRGVRVVDGAVGVRGTCDVSERTRCSK
jgi:hypothetical protein